MEPTTGLFIEKAEALFSAEVKRIEMFCPELTTQFKCKSLLHEVLVVKILKKICDVSIYCIILQNAL